MQRGWKFVSRKNLPSNSRVSEKSSEQQRAQCGYWTYLLQPQSRWEPSLDSRTGHQNVAWKQTDCQLLPSNNGFIWDQQIIVIWGLPLLWATRKSPAEENIFMEGKRKWEGHSYQKVHGFSLAELWQSVIGWILARKEEEIFFLLPGLFHHRRVWELPLPVS